MRQFFYFVLIGASFSMSACTKDSPFAPAEYIALVPRVWYEQAVQEMTECVGRKISVRYEDIVWKQAPGHTIPVGDINAMGVTVGRTVYIAYDFQNTRAVVVHEAAHVMFAQKDAHHEDEFWGRCIEHFTETWQDGLTTVHGIKMVPFDSPDGRSH